jgi:hypothetical protein
VDSGENLPAAQFHRVLENRRGGIFVQFRAVAQHHQHGVGKIVSVHAPELAKPQAARKPGCAIFLETF